MSSSHRTLSLCRRACFRCASRMCHLEKRPRWVYPPFGAYHSPLGKVQGDHRLQNSLERHGQVIWSMTSFYGELNGLVETRITCQQDQRESAAISTPQLICQTHQTYVPSLPELPASTYQFSLESPRQSATVTARNPFFCNVLIMNSVRLYTVCWWIS